MSTYQFTPADGSGTLPPTPITNNSLFGMMPGTYDITGVGISFIGGSADTVRFEQGSGYDLTIQPHGGFLFNSGTNNLGIANAGTWTVTDHGYSSPPAPVTDNRFIVGDGVTQFNAGVGSTDNIFLQGVTQADINAAFANEHPVSSNIPNLTMSVNRAGGTPLTINVQQHYGLSLSQVHPLA